MTSNGQISGSSQLVQQTVSSSENIKVNLNMPIEEGSAGGMVTMNATNSTAKRKRGIMSNAPVRVPLPMAKKTIDSIIYPVKTKRGIKFGKDKKMLSPEAIAAQ